MKIVILAGGGGTRLWPWSREHQPKQLQSILGSRTLLQRTFDRATKLVTPKDIFIATGAAYAASIRKQLPRIPKENILAEPVRRDSAGAIGLAAAVVASIDPQEVLVSIHADAWIDNDTRFAAHIKKCVQQVKHHPDHTFLTGVVPTYPETGYGYIQLGTNIVQRKSYSVHVVKKFIEKPSLKRAQSYIKNGNYLWNPGWFVWRVDTLLQLYKKYLPKEYRVLEKIQQAPKSKRAQVIKKEFPKLKPHTIDHAILEKTKKILVLPTNIGWSDIGHWRSVQEMSKKDHDGNVVDSSSVLLDSENNLFVSNSGKYITSIGIKNVVMVETDEVILLVHKDRAQDVKMLVSLLGKNTHTKKLL